MTKIDEGSYKGWNVTTNKGTKTAEVASDGNVDFSNNDKNIIVGQDGTNLTFDLNDKITLGDESSTRIELNGSPETDSMISITKGDSHTVFNVAKDGTVLSDGDIVADADNNKYSLSEVGKNAVRYNEDKSKVILAGGTNGTTITNVANGIDETDAVNVRQLNAVDKKVNAGWTAKVGDDEINVRPNGENETGKDTLSFAGDNNITVTADSENNAINVKLNPDLTLAGETKGNSIKLSGTGGYAQVVQGNTYTDIQGGTVTVGSDINGVNKKIVIDGTTGEMSGLSNTTLDVDGFAKSNRAATEEQLQLAMSQAGENATKGDTYLHNGTEQIITDKGTVTGYKVNEDGTVTMTVANADGTKSRDSVVIGNVASKQELDSVKDNIGDMDFSDTNYIKGDTNLTDAVVDLDDAIKDTNDRIDGLGDKIDEVSNSSITGGKINEDTGKIDLIKNDGTAVTMEGQLSDSILDTVDDSKLKSDGEIILTSHDKYDPNKTESVTLNDIASKTNLDNLSSTVGATTTEELKESYKDTAYINDADTMVDADVKLDQAVQNVASTSYANDMYLNERINNVESRLGDVEERIDKVGAMAAAIANLRTMGYDPEAPTEIAVGVGQYKSETGLALGIFHYPNQDFMLSASLSSSGDELMGGIGATWKLGRKSAAERAKDEEARHLEQAEEMKKLAQQEKVKAQAQRHAKLLAERQQASQKNA